MNEWLIKEGYLKLKNNPEGIKNLGEAGVDWSKTIAWAWGGYYARIFINLKGRERNGVVDPEDYESIREQLKREIEGIRGPNGEKWNTKAYKPEDLYPVCNGNPPDLIVYLDDLYWRSAGTIGHGTLYLPENDLGPDDAVHDYEGIFILYDPDREIGERTDLSIYDVAPTILNIMDLPIPSNMEGKVLEEIL